MGNALHIWELSDTILPLILHDAKLVLNVIILSSFKEFIQFGSLHTVVNFLYISTLSSFICDPFHQLEQHHNHVELHRVLSSQPKIVKNESFYVETDLSHLTDN